MPMIDVNMPERENIDLKTARQKEFDYINAPH
jgi:hypothetical protein